MAAVSVHQTVLDILEEGWFRIETRRCLTAQIRIYLPTVPQPMTPETTGLAPHRHINFSLKKLIGLPRSLLTLA
jgi:hypothetical protein